MHYLYMLLVLCAPPNLLDVKDTSKQVKVNPLVEQVAKLKSEVSELSAENLKLTRQLEELKVAASAPTPPDESTKLAELELFKKEMAEKYGKVEQSYSALEQKYGAKINLFDVDSPAENEDYETVRKQRDSLREQLNTASMFDLSGLTATANANQFAYVRVTISRACGACHVFVNNLRRYLMSQGWRIGSDSSDHFQIISISQQEWERLDLTLPKVELVANGVATETSERDPVTLANMILAVNKGVKQDVEEQVAGLTVGTIKGSQAIGKILNQLDPFLDGGTITLAYEPRPGVVKEWLTIKQGSAGVKIPAKLSYKLKIDKDDSGNKQLTIVPVGVPLQVIASAIERNVNRVELTPNKLSVRLPWMVDPEWKIVDEDTTHSYQDEVYGDAQPRSGRWPTVRKHHLESHPYCLACRSRYGLEVHHKVPFHNNPDLELEPTNLRTFCRQHHFEVGHDPDGIDRPLKPRWDLSNPDCDEDAAKLYHRLNPIKSPLFGQ